jgi:hypothetical protein
MSLVQPFMTIEELRILHKKFTQFPLSKEIWATQEYNKYLEAFYENKEFYNWILSSKFQSAGFPYLDFCCLEMASKIFESLTEQGKIKHNDPDVKMNKWEDGTYGIPIHD